MTKILDKNIQYILLNAILFAIPLNFYIIGNRLGAALQWIFFRYQVSYMGTSILTLGNDIEYVLNGTYNGRTAFSIGFWVIGTIFIICSLLLLLYCRLNERPSYKIPGILIIVGGIFMCLSIMFQYGVILVGPAGMSIPIGLPVIFIFGLILILDKKDDFKEEIPE